MFLQLNNLQYWIEAGVTLQNSMVIEEPKNSSVIRYDSSQFLRNFSLHTVCSSIMTAEYHHVDLS